MIRNKIVEVVHRDCMTGWQVFFMKNGQPFASKIFTTEKDAKKLLSEVCNVL
jgi:hypothetical protein